MRYRRISFLVVAALLIAISVRPPSADIRILAHQSSDHNPMRVQAALDFGFVAVSVLVTWTRRLV